MPDIDDENAINIYTDGSSYSGPWQGGLGIVFVTVDRDGNEVVEEHQPQGYRGATNNQMELQACIEALELLMRGRTNIDLDRFRKIIIKTDSMYVTDSYGRAMFGWSRNHWRTREGRPINNATQWKELLKRVKGTGKRVEFRWVEGHRDSAHNKTADKLAKRSAKGVTKAPLGVSSVRRKLTEKSIEVGSVQVQGQDLTIRAHHGHLAFASEGVEVQVRGHVCFESLQGKRRAFRVDSRNSICYCEPVMCTLFDFGDQQAFPKILGLSEKRSSIRSRSPKQGERALETHQLAARFCLTSKDGVRRLEVVQELGSVP